MLLRVDSGVATVTLNRAEAKNRLDAESMALLLEHLHATAQDPQVRVVVLTGSGTTFCSGADLSGALAATSGGFASGGTSGLVEVLTAMLDHPKPIVGRIQGHVAGGGNGLVAACDIAVASADAKFAFSEVRVGVAPAIISVVCLQVMHRRDGQELLLTGERVSAVRVRDAGLVTHVVEADGLDAAVTGYVDQLAQGGPEAVARTKELLRRVPAMTRDDAFAWTAEVSAGLFTSAEAREGMTAFIEKRKPEWAP
ncbi:MAG: enoyl-CoA hydratase/isomerase family protein [Candidatus Nanopelagicales bacterium]